METSRTAGTENGLDESAKEIVRDIVLGVLEAGHEWTVRHLTSEVKKEAERKVQGLRAQCGNRIQGLAGGILREAESYAEMRKKVLDPEAKVSNIGERYGAAGLNSKTDNSVTYDKAAMKPDADLGYQGRVAEHERIHQEDQAAFYNEETISYIDGQNRMKTVEVYSTLVEWQPSSIANKPEDLTEKYKGHVDDGNDFIQAVGGDTKTRLVSALKSGNMTGLQKEVIQKQKPKFLKLHLAGEMNATDLN